MRLEREAVDSFVLRGGGGGGGMVCTRHNTLIQLFNLSESFLVSLIFKFL